MIKTVIIQHITDGENIYRKGDRVRVKMKPRDAVRSDRANEYIGEIMHIAENHILLHIGIDTRLLDVNNIDRIRFARTEENFIDAWDF